MTFHKKHPILLAIGALVLGGLLVILVAFFSAISSRNLSVSSPSSYDAITSSTGYSRALDIDFGSSEGLADAEESVDYDDAGSSDVSAEDQKIIKTGTVYVTVDDANEAADGLDAIAETYGGYVLTKSLTSDDDGSTSGYVTFRVSEEHFETAMLEAKALASGQTYEYISAEDVTEDYLDLEARLRNAEAQEERYLAILGQATTIDDILAVERYLVSTREDIEVLQGQLNYLDSRTDFSMITVYVSEDSQIVLDVPGFRPGETFAEAVNALIHIVQGFINFAIYLVVVVGPFVLIAWIIVKIVRARRDRHNGLKRKR